MRSTKIVFIVLFILLVASMQAQEFVPLWPAGKKPNNNGKKITDSIYNERIWRVATPGIYCFVVPKAENNGTAVLIIPGGGYERLSHLYSGFNLAKWYNTIGVNAFVLIHRLPHQQDLINKQLASVQDAQRAMRIIRANAQQWNIKTEHVGVMGISAGGHVASTLGTHAKDESAIKDTVDQYSFRPSFMVLLSPVITMGKFAHGGSKKNFIGADTTKANIENYSSELQVSEFTPSTFMVHAQNDSAVKVQNSLLFYQALVEKKISASLHVFPQGGHGIRLDENPGSTDQWLNLVEAWLKEMKFINPLSFK
ncbi:acetyl esterase/lipase [Lacibacter cauensis]|uniref:Acetyl esterase/lipase n=1 Tax=Lacibacter cauensis TaxID=510947 RepID=A0A562SPW0_9BACT|nr:alpha/beta hydrolase [Lacibacter cauensis]TWI83309.1 acetyl esterase/lipase [Lacibacter cauensis]